MGFDDGDGDGGGGGLFWILGSAWPRYGYPGRFCEELTSRRSCRKRPSHSFFFDICRAARSAHTTKDSP